MQTHEPKLTFTESARRAQILHATIATINDLGYHRTSLAEIADTAGVAKSALIYYFGSKDGVLLHVLNRTFSSLGAAVESAVTAESTPTNQMRAYAQAYLDHIAAHRADVAAAVTIVVSHRGADGTPLYLTASDEDTALLRRILSAGMEQNTFRRIPIADAVQIVESLLDIVITAVQRDLTADLTTLIPEIIAFIFRGLSPAEETGRPRGEAL